MKSNKFIFLFLVSISSVFSSCGSLYFFTSEIKKEYQLSSDNIRRVQFYVSSPITLHRIEKKVSRSLTDQHSLESTLKEHEEMIVINTNTPGVAILDSEDILSINFGEGIICQFTPIFVDNVTLYFLEEINGNNIFSKEDIIKEKYSFQHAPLQHIHRNNKEYEVIFDNTSQGYRDWPELLFDQSILNYSEKETKVIKGIKLK